MLRKSQKTRRNQAFRARTTKQATSIPAMLVEFQTIRNWHTSATAVERMSAFRIIASGERNLKRARLSIPVENWLGFLTSPVQKIDRSLEDDSDDLIDVAHNRGYVQNSPDHALRVKAFADYGKPVLGLELPASGNTPEGPIGHACWFFIAV